MKLPPIPLYRYFPSRAHAPLPTGWRSPYSVRYPVPEPKERRKMTIALGVLCGDGIVLGADSQYSGGISKTSGQKIYPICQNRRCTVTIAGAGNVALTKRAVECFKKRLVADDYPSQGESIRALLEDALCEVYTKHIYPAPADERSILDFWLLMGVWAPDTLNLFRSDVTAVTPVDDSACIGTGSYLGNYLTDLLCKLPRMMSVEDVKPIVAYVVRSAKEFVDGCGLKTHMRIVTNNGIDERISTEEVEDGERCFDGLLLPVRHLLIGALHVNTPPLNLEPMSVALKSAIEVYRNKQSERLKVITKRRATITSATT